MEERGIALCRKVASHFAFPMLAIMSCGVTRAISEQPKSAPSLRRTLMKTLSLRTRRTEGAGDQTNRRTPRRYTQIDPAETCTHCRFRSSS